MISDMFLLLRGRDAVKFPPRLPSCPLGEHWERAWLPRVNWTLICSFCPRGSWGTRLICLDIRSRCDFCLFSKRWSHVMTAGGRRLRPHVATCGWRRRLPPCDFHSWLTWWCLFPWYLHRLGHLLNLPLSLWLEMTPEDPLTSWMTTEDALTHFPTYRLHRESFHGLELFLWLESLDPLLSKNKEYI